MNVDISVLDYVPAPDLDADLAHLAYDAVRGWPDQRPYTAGFLRSRLRPRGMTATTLVLGREHGGRLVAAAALRWPATLEDTGHLFGPIVHPDARGAGVGTDVLAAMIDVIANRPGVRVTTIAVPESRTIGWSLFEREGWTPVRTSVLLQRELPAEILLTTVPVRAPKPGEYLDPAIAALAAAARPDLSYAAARDTLAQWRDDERYTSDGLLLVDGPDGLIGAALVYPLAHPGIGEPAEARLEEVLVAERLDPEMSTQVRAALVAAALHVGAAAGATVARAEVDDTELVATLHGAGFEVVDRIRYYSPPASEPVLANTASIATAAA
jgi:ribosomal protein S18 acetylase RimI-like enzyme